MKPPDIRQPAQVAPTGARLLGIVLNKQQEYVAMAGKLQASTSVVDRGAERERERVYIEKYTERYYREP